MITVDGARSTPLYATIEKIAVPFIESYPGYHPEDNGYFVLVESDDVNRVLADLELPWRLSEAPFDGASIIDKCHYAACLPNNQSVLPSLIPDEPWITDELRHHLEPLLDL